MLSDEVMILHSPDHIPHEEEEGVSGRGAKVFPIDRWLEAKCSHYIKITFNIIKYQAFNHTSSETWINNNWNTYHNIRISVQELDKFLQTPETALQTAQQELCKLILGSCEWEQSTFNRC